MLLTAALRRYVRRDEYEQEAHDQTDQSPFDVRSPGPAVPIQVRVHYPVGHEVILRRRLSGDLCALLRLFRQSSAT
jgi:hypothetical protein